MILFIFLFFYSFLSLLTIRKRLDRTNEGDGTG